MLQKSQAELEKIRASCKAMVRRRAATSGGMSLIPIPGVDIAGDVGMLLQLIPAINRKFGLTPEQISLAITGATSMNTASSAVAASLVKWHRMVAARDFSGLPELLHADACFRSPMALKPYHSAQAVALILGTVVSVFEDFVYGREFAAPDGLNIVLEFSARIGDKQLKGIDMIRFDEQGRIVDFEVMIRPFNSLQTLGDAMGRRLGNILPAYKTGQSVT